MPGTVSVTRSGGRERFGTVTRACGALFSVPLSCRSRRAFQQDFIERAARCARVCQACGRPCATRSQCFPCPARASAGRTGRQPASAASHGVAPRAPRHRPRRASLSWTPSVVRPAVEPAIEKGQSLCLRPAEHPVSCRPADDGNATASPTRSPPRIWRSCGDRRGRRGRRRPARLGTRHEGRCGPGRGSAV